MRQLRTFGDERELCFCAYCGGVPETRDHVPSRVLLDEPYPENLPVVPACKSCNSGFSADEEYVACLIESVLTGHANSSAVQRPKIQRILSDKPALLARLRSARVVNQNGTSFQIEEVRLKQLFRKLGCGHSLFELHIPHSGAEPQIWMAPLPLLSADELYAFESLPLPSLLPEVGSRALIEQAERGSFLPEWVVVQPGRYRYAAWVGETLAVRIVLSEYLAGHIEWAV